MSTRLAADRRIRAAALRAAPGLDVRGPVSQALGRAGITVPPAPLAGAVPSGLADEPAETTDLRETAAPDTTPAPTASRSKAAPRVVKPFAEAPWPTRPAGPAAPEPPAALSGLTADERRVHRILLDTLARENASSDVSDGLTYAEKKHLGTLNLAFIDREIVQIERKNASLSRMRTAVLAAAVILIPLVAALSFVFRGPDSLLPALSLAALAFSAMIPVKKAGNQRLPIYRALRELALLADPGGVTSDALAQADAVIDRLAGADHGPRLRLDDAPATTASATTASAAGRPRVRS